MAAAVFTEWFDTHLDELDASPQAAMGRAFEAAHEGVRRAILDK